MITLTIILIILAVIIGVIVYLVMGTWVAGLICFLASLITICVTVFAVKLIKRYKQKQ